MSEGAGILPPFAERHTPLGWARKNLFNTWANALLTLLALWFIVWTGRALGNWIFTSAEWSVIAVNLRLILVGQFPIAQVWRLWLSLLLLAFLVGNSLGIWGRKARRIAVALALAPLLLALLPFELQPRLWLLGLSVAGALGWLLGSGSGRAARRAILLGWVVWPLAFILLLRGLTAPEGPLPLVASSLWGGLLLTFLLTVVGIVFSFPLGILLALGRRSQLGAVRWFSVAYIELIRGVPLITILFMAQLMLPLFLPSGLTIDRVLRAMVGITLFSAAYLAENVRGGLQAISRGQFEAAYAVGLNGVQTMSLIILPQALRLVIPILVGQFIALLKDTSLVAIVGLFDLLGIAKTILAQPEFLGLQREVYAFISMLYWIFSYAMSYVSQRLEIALGVGKR